VAGALLGAPQPEHLELAMPVLGIALIIGSLLLLRHIRRAERRRVLVYGDGLIFQHGGQLVIVPWRAIAAVWWYGNATWTMTLSCRDGKSYQFSDDSFKNARQLAEMTTAEAERRSIHIQRGLPTLSAGSELPRFSLDRLDTESMRLVKSAEELARKQSHDYLGTDHVLLALLLADPNDATRLLRKCGADVSAMEGLLRSRMLPGESASGPALRPPQTPALRKVLQEACNAAPTARGSVALLLGLAQEPDGVAGQVMGEYGITQSAILTAMSGASTLLT
jgi:ATP-dependent Clp protease ATP-binding subunit ClpC